MTITNPMKLPYTAIAVLASLLLGCHSAEKKKTTEEEKTYADVEVVSAMRNVMWKGELGSNIQLDSISNKKGLYGIGPVSYLQGELLINDGSSYVSTVVTDSAMKVTKTYKVGAPFFVYTHVKEWQQVDVPASLKNIKQLETFISNQVKDMKKPLAFKLAGHVASAHIHIQNLPDGAVVSSPQEAHQGQVNYKLYDEAVEIVGFYSTEHKGIFTHHDSFVHMHLITQDELQMGHLDEVEIKDMKLFLPSK